MTTLTITGVRDAHVLSSKPTTAFGGPALLRVRASAALTYLQVALPVLPEGASIDSAYLEWVQSGAYTGSVTVSAQRVERWVARKVTWDTKPATVSGSPVSSVTKSGSADKTIWSHDVTADVVAWHSGDEPNYGWQLSTNSATVKLINGFEAPRERLRPRLVLTYTPLAAVATDLAPSFGAVSVTKPRLSWSATDFDELRVQVALDGDFVTPDFDSGWTTSSTAAFNLATSAFAGTTVGASWRVNLRDAGGEAGWSQAASWTYAALPTLTITEPGATVTDPSPPTIWTCPGQAHWRHILTVGDQTIDTGWQVGTTLSHTPNYTIAAPGTVAKVTVQARDAVVREALDGAPAYAEDSQEFTFELVDGIPAVSWVTASLDFDLPVITVGWDRTETADGWAIERDGKIIATLDALEPAEASSFQWEDWTCPPNRQHTYRVLPIVNGETGDTSPTATITPTVTGVWLVDPNEGLSLVLANTNLNLNHGEQSTVYTPINAKRAVKVNHGMQGLSGNISGLIDNVLGRPWEEQEADLWAMKRNTSRTFRLIAGDLNIPVVLMNVTSLVSGETLPHGWRQNVSLEVLQQATDAEPLPWEA